MGELNDESIQENWRAMNIVISNVARHFLVVHKERRHCCRPDHCHALHVLGKNGSHASQDDQITLLGRTLGTSTHDINPNWRTPKSFRWISSQKNSHLTCTMTVFIARPCTCHSTFGYPPPRESRHVVDPIKFLTAGKHLHYLEEQKKRIQHKIVRLNSRRTSQRNVAKKKKRDTVFKIATLSVLRILSCHRNAQGTSLAMDNLRHRTVHLMSRCSVRKTRNTASTAQTRTQRPSQYTSPNPK